MALSFSILEWTLSTSFCQHQCLHFSEDQYTIGHQKFLCRWTMSLEQSTQHSATAWHWLWAVQTTTEDIFVCLKQWHTCNFLYFFDMPCINSLMYLITYMGPCVVYYMASAQPMRRCGWFIPTHFAEWTVAVFVHAMLSLQNQAQYEKYKMRKWENDNLINSKPCPVSNYHRTCQGLRV